MTCLAFTSVVPAQNGKIKEKNKLVPYAGIIYGGCGVSNPVSFLAGVDKQFKPHLTVSYDLHYMNTNYECNCDDVYSKGHYSSFTPSIKLSFNSGKKTGRGLIGGVGLGYMFAKDRGTEEKYAVDPSTQKSVLSGKVVNGNWDFNSISPSVLFGVGFRILKLPVSFYNTFYFAKTTEGWNPVAGGVSCKIGFRRL